MEALATSTNDSKVVRKFLKKNIFTGFSTTRLFWVTMELIFTISISSFSWWSIRGFSQGCYSFSHPNEQASWAIQPWVEQHSREDGRLVSQGLAFEAWWCLMGIPNYLQDSSWDYSLSISVWKVLIFTDWTWTQGILDHSNAQLWSKGCQRAKDVATHNVLRLEAYESSKIYKEWTKHWCDKYIMKKRFDKGDMVLLFNSKLRLFRGKMRS